MCTVRQQAFPIVYQGARIEMGFRADLACSRSTDSANQDYPEAATHAITTMEGTKPDTIVAAHHSVF